MTERTSLNLFVHALKLNRVCLQATPMLMEDTHNIISIHQITERIQQKFIQVG